MHDYVTRHFTPPRIRREMTQDEARFYLVRSSGGAGGYAKTRYATPPECVSGPYLELQRLYVLSKHKGTGLGGLLLRAILRSSIAESRAGLWLGVDQANAHAISFYRRFGFKIVGTKEFALGASVHPDFVMSRSLRYAGS